MSSQSDLDDVTAAELVELFSHIYSVSGKAGREPNVESSEITVSDAVFLRFSRLPGHMSFWKDIDIAAVEVADNQQANYFLVCDKLKEAITESGLVFMKAFPIAERMIEFETNKGGADHLRLSSNALMRLGVLRSNPEKLFELEKKSRSMSRTSCTIL